VVPGLSPVVVAVVWFVPSCYSDLAISAHTHGFDEVRMHPYGHPLHWKVLKHFICMRWKCNPVWSGSRPQPFIVVWIVTICYSVFFSYSAAQPTSIVLWSKVKHLLHWKVLKHLISILDGSVFKSEVITVLNHFILVWIIPICSPPPHGFVK
jgi:hypothetical protein